DFATADGTATAGLDYIAKSGMLTFGSGELTKTISVTVLGDLLDEFPSEDFVLNLTNSVNATIADSQATGTIIDDDAKTISINDVIIDPEGDGGGSLQFAPAVNLPSTSGDFVTSIASADFDGDGLLDLVTGNDTNVSVFLNVGGGSFGQATLFPSGATVESVTTGDFDADGDVDCLDATAFSDAQTISPTSPPPAECVVIPAVSEWGLIVLALLTLAAASVILMRARFAANM
ncbi:MAG: IPTL-CTERM sorting domain-containing protein, partial [Planctomycetes bacterium]|nr:IPTL-CTERM sorting domain-containing protein [Planctomycetota bacterium]